MKRFDCLKTLASLVQDELVVAGLGATTIQWNSLKPRSANILQLGMGLPAPVGLGLALALPHRKVLVLEGDGSLLLNLGILSTMANKNPGNLIVVVCDNECYEGGGGGIIPTMTGTVTDLELTAKGTGIKNSFTARTVEDLERLAAAALKGDELTFLVAKLETGIERLAPPTVDGTENKYRFVRYIEETEKIQILYPPTQRPSFVQR